MDQLHEQFLSRRTRLKNVKLPNPKLFNSIYNHGRLVIQFANRVSYICVCSKYFNVKVSEIYTRSDLYEYFTIDMEKYTKIFSVLSLIDPKNYDIASLNFMYLDDTGRVRGYEFSRISNSKLPF